MTTPDRGWRNLKRFSSLFKSSIRFFIPSQHRNPREIRLRDTLDLWHCQKLFRKNRPNIPSLSTSSGVANSDDQKANILAITLKDNFAENKRPGNGSHPIDKEITKTLENFFSSPPTLPLTPTDPTEICDYIRRLKNNKAPGSDQITNKMVKNFNTKTLLILTYLINKILFLRHFPNNWKNAIVFPIKKPDKNAHNPSSYRPISLLSVLSKITEYVILNRLKSFTNDNNFINPNQYGFTRNLSTYHPLLGLTEKITAGFQRGRSTGAVFLDIQKAFDRVWNFAAKTVPVTTPPCHFQPTNQDSLSNQGPPTSGHIHKIRYGMEERFAFHFPSDDQRPAKSEIKSKIHQRNRLRKFWQRSRCPSIYSEFRTLSREIAKDIKSHSQAQWEKHIEALSPEDNTLWRNSSLLRKPFRSIPPLKGALGSTAITPIEKAEVIADSLQEQFEPNHVADREVFDQRIHEEVANFLATPHVQEIEPTTPTEVLTYVQRIKPKKSPGLDQISNRMLKNLPLKFLFFITFLINQLFKNNYFPDSWKTAVVIPILKPDKNPELAQNYRPISLLSCLSKVYEFVLMQRLNQHCAAVNFIIPQQCGFRPKCSTVHQLLRVTELIHSGFAKHEATGILFLDIAKAFDKIWHDGLLIKLIRLDFPAPLIDHLE
ncbi:probable RNA-directed DNA polymerase from transposon X-element [Trichonephila clavipes]|nr:probable RNA-directed DNA polymerase from transposon X-element [Trichonephila clavipes]